MALTDGGEGVLFGYGPVLLSEAYRASALLRERYGLGLRVVNLPWLNLVDRNGWRAKSADKAQIFFLDDHYVSGGQGEMLAATLAELGLAGGRTVRRLRRPRHSRLRPERRSRSGPPPGRRSLAEDLAAAMGEGRPIDAGVLGHRRHAADHRQRRDLRLAGGAARVAGREADLWSFDTAGHPDFGIARRLLSEYAGQAEPDPATVRRLVERYEDRLPRLSIGGSAA